MLAMKILWKLAFHDCVFIAPFTLLVSAFHNTKGFEFMGYSITWSSFKPEPANERPCKSCVEFALAKDYRDTFPKLSSSSWIVHWCKEREPENPHTTVQLFLSFFLLLWVVVSSEQLYLTMWNDKGKWFKSHLICVVSIQKESKLIYCSLNGWNTTLLNVIKNLRSAPGLNKRIRNTVAT